MRPVRRTAADRVPAHRRLVPGQALASLAFDGAHRLGSVACPGRLLRASLQPGRDLAQRRLERSARPGRDRGTALDANRVDRCGSWSTLALDWRTTFGAGTPTGACSKSAVRPTWLCRSGRPRPSRSPRPSGHLHVHRARDQRSRTERRVEPRVADFPGSLPHSAGDTGAIHGPSRRQRPPRPLGSSHEGPGGDRLPARGVGRIHRRVRHHAAIARRHRRSRRLRRCG